MAAAGSQEGNYVVEPAEAPAPQDIFPHTEKPTFPFLVVDRFWCKVLLTAGFCYILGHVVYSFLVTMGEISKDPADDGWYPLLGIFFGLCFGYFKAPVMSGYFCASMARIESLPFCYPWDFMIFEFFIACAIVVPLLHFFREFALEEGGFFYTLEVFLEVAVIVMFGSVTPCLVYYWRHPAVGTRQCVYDWQKRLPFYGTYVTKVFKFLVERLKDKLEMGRKWPVNYLVRPWGADCNTEHQQISDGSEASSNI